MKKLVLPLLSAIVALCLGSCDTVSEKPVNNKKTNECNQCETCEPVDTCQSDLSCGCESRCAEKAKGKFYPYSNGDKNKTSPSDRVRHERRW